MSELVLIGDRFIFGIEGVAVNVVLVSCPNITGVCLVVVVVCVWLLCVLGCSWLWC